MPEVDWSLFKTPTNIVGNAYAARAEGQAIRRQQGLQNAYATYSRDPNAGIAAIAAYDPLAAGQLQDRQVATQAREARTKAAGQYTSGDVKGAQSTAAAAGDFDLLKHFRDMTKEQLEESKRVNDIGVSVSLGLKNLPSPEQRQAKLQAMVPKLKEQGFTDAQIAAIPTDDAGIEAGVGMAMKAGEIIAQQQKDREFKAGREDETFNRDIETKKFGEQVRGNRVAEGQRAQQIGISAASEARQARAGQVKLTEGQAKDGFSAKRIAAANRVMSRLEADPKFVATLSSVGASVGGDKSRQYTQARDEWSDSMIRLTTGAAATKEEIAAANRTYFPLPMDSQSVVTQKADARRRIEADAITRAGPGANGMSAPAAANRPSLAAIFGG